MTRPAEQAAAVVANAMSRRAPKERAELLREIMSSAAAGLVVMEGHPSAAEHVYRLADTIAAREGL